MHGSYLGLPVWHQSQWAATKRTPIEHAGVWSDISGMIRSRDAVLFCQTRSHGRGGHAPANDMVDQIAKAFSGRICIECQLGVFPLDEHDIGWELLHGLRPVNFRRLASGDPEWQGATAFTQKLQALYPPPPNSAHSGAET